MVPLLVGAFLHGVAQAQGPASPAPAQPSRGGVAAPDPAADLALEQTLRRALAEREAADGRDHPATLEAMARLASHLSLQEKVQEAAALYRRLLSGRDATNGPDHEDSVEAARSLAALLNGEGRYAEAEPLYRRVLEARERTLGATHPKTREAIEYLSGVLLHLNRNQEAGLLIDRARADRERAALATADGPERTYELARAANGDRRPEAETLYRRALEQSRQAKGADDDLTLRIQTDLADLLFKTDRPDEAERLYRDAITASERRGGVEEFDTRFRIDRLAFQFRLKGRYAEEEPLLQRLLAYEESRNRPNNFEVPTLLQQLATNHSRRGRHADAERYFRRALSEFERLYGRTDPTTLRIADAFVRSELTRRDGAPGIALQTAELMVNGLRDRRALVGSGAAADRQREVEAVEAAVQFALFADAAFQAGGNREETQAPLIAKAFEALQEATAGPASSAIARMAVQREASRSPDIALLVRQREQAVARSAQLGEQYAESFASDAPDAPAVRAKISRDQEQLHQQLASIDTQLAARFPQFQALTRPDPLSIKAAKALVDADEAILLVVPSAFGTHVVAVSADTAAWRRSTWTVEEVRRTVQRLRWDAGAIVQGSDQEIATLNQGDAEGRPRFDRAAAHQLYRQVVAPVASVLAGKKRIYIVGANALAGLPFSLLVSAPPAGADDDPAALRSTRWFGDDAGLVHLPSIQSLALLRGASARTGGKEFIGVGNPVLGPAMVRERQRTRGAGTARQLFRAGATREGELAIDLPTLRAMPSLPGTGVELEAVRRTLGAPASSLLTQAAATEAAVRSADLSQAAILLFSTHGLTAAEALGVGEPGLVLTPTMEEGNNRNDGYLSASEVAALNLRAEWVILSACNTATDDGSGNGGLGPLARAFFFAGARNILASHWPVSDDVAPLLITRTLALEQGGATRAEAFQLAAREIRENKAHPDWAHPFYWAPFVLIGDGAR
jgi:CHAT domain-containing protein/tetratricopeptide (TPR) repeat protein